MLDGPLKGQILMVTRAKCCVNKGSHPHVERPKGDLLRQFLPKCFMHFGSESPKGHMSLFLDSRNLGFLLFKCVRNGALSVEGGVKYLTNFNTI